MRHSKSNLSEVICREPFGKVTELMQVPIALFEILALASESEDPKAKLIAKLAENVIEVTLEDPEALVKLANMAWNGYTIRFSE